MEQKNQQNDSDNKTSLPPPPQPGGLQGAFHYRRVPFPWPRAVGASICVGVPFLVGAGGGHLSTGLLAMMGGFTYLYAHKEPYAQRAVKLLLVLLGLAFVFAIGTLAAVSAWTTAIALGLIGTCATFITGALSVPPPAGFFFVLVCAVGTGLPVDPASAPQRALLVLLGGCFGIAVAMAGVLFNRTGPEETAVAQAYREIAALLAAIGSQQSYAAQHNVALALRTAENAVRARKIRFGRQGEADRLERMTLRASAVFLAAIERCAERPHPESPELTAAVRALADTISDPNRAASLAIPAPREDTPGALRLYRELTAAAAIAAGRPTEESENVRLAQRRLRAVFSGALNKRSLVLPTALRLGVMLLIATVVAHALGNPRPYWVPLSCAAVLQGTTVLAALHRSIQRALGTMIGIFIGGAILAMHPTAWVMAIAVMVLQCLVETIIVRNYGIAVTFITPIPLLIAEAGNPSLAVATVIGARLFDTLLGCVLAFVGVLLLWRRSSSARLPNVLGEVIRSEGRLLQALLAEGSCPEHLPVCRERHQLQTALLNLRAVYDSALGEFPRQNATVLSLWPALMAAQRLGYLAMAASERQRLATLSTADLAQLEQAFGELAAAVESGRRPAAVLWPEMPAYPRMAAEWQALHEGLKVAER